MNKKIITKKQKETEKVAKQIAQKLTGGEIICLHGNLGAGKTVFVKGLARGLGIKKIITSPTFVLIKNYSVKNNQIKNLVHVDTYRLTNAEELIDIGIGEYLNKKNTIVVIEWPEKLKKLLKKYEKIIWVEIKIGKNNERKMEVRKV